MRKGYRAVFVLAMMVGLEPSLQAQGSVEMLGGVEWKERVAAPMADLGALVEARDRTAGGLTRLAHADIRASLGSDGVESGHGTCSLSVSRLQGRANLGLLVGVFGYLPDESGAGLIGFRVRTPATLNGAVVSLGLEPEFAVDTERLEGAFNATLSLLVGQVVLKPGIGFSTSRAWDGSVILSLAPAVGLSWYPGFPVSIGLNGSVSLDAALPSSGLKSWTANFLGLAMPFRGLMLKIEGDALSSSDGDAFRLDLEAAIDIMDKGKGPVLSVPLRAGWTVEGGVTSYSLSAGIRCSL